MLYIIIGIAILSYCTVILMEIRKIINTLNEFRLRLENIERKLDWTEEQIDQIKNNH